MGKTVTLNFDHLSPSDRKIVTAVAARGRVYGALRLPLKTFGK
jgi:hypothetical protein